MAVNTICPLKFNANTEVVAHGYLCEMDECAWWDKEVEKCAVVTLLQPKREGVE